MTYLGIDYGTKRIGLAKGNDEEHLAMPLRTIPHDSEVFNTIRDILIREHVGEVVVGIPTSFDGEEHQTARDARTFGERLSKELEVRVHFVNELLTSKQSRDSGVSDVDASAAALILQNYLDQ